MSKPHKPNRRRVKARRHQPSKPAISRKPPVLPPVEPVVERVKINKALVWYVVRTYPQHEARVMARLGGLKRDVYLPQQSVKTVRHGRLVTDRRYMLPRHMFIGLPPRSDPWQAILDENAQPIQGVYDIFRFNGFDVRISGRELQEFADTVQDEGLEKSRRRLGPKKGDRLRVIDGPFAQFIALIRSAASGGMVAADIDIFGRPTPVDLRVDQLEAAE